MVLSDLIELMVRGRGRGWKCQIRRAEQRDQCAVTVYTQETRICSAEPPKKKTLPSLMQHFWGGKQIERKRMRLAEKQRPQETWSSSEVSLVHWAVFQQLMTLFISVAVTVEKRPVWNDRRQGFFYSVLYDEGEENRMRWRRALREAWSMDACQGEIYVLASGRECGRVGGGKCRKPADAICRGEFYTLSNMVEVQSLGKS